MLENKPLPSIPYAGIPLEVKILLVTGIQIGKPVIISKRIVPKAQISVLDSVIILNNFYFISFELYELSKFIR